MIKFGTARKAIAILANVSLLFNSFVPFLLVAQPAYAQSSEFVAPTIEYNQSANKINVKVNTSEKVAYQLFYKTDKIDAIAGNDLALGNFYLGTCSASVCLPQNINRGILKIESGSEFHSQFFTIENNVLTVVKESNSNQSDLTNEENDFLENISQWTFEKVELNKEYVAPQNSGVKLTFTKLPTNSGNIKIEEITLTQEQIEQSGSLSDKAYDITSDMADGTFAYNLSLPIPESAKGQNVDIKFAEDISQINSTQTADNTTETNTVVSATNLDHFTIFIVSATLATATLNNQSQVTVYPNDTISVTLNVNLNKLSGWGYSEWKIGAGNWNYFNTPDHLSGWSTYNFSGNFNITAPSNVGTYDVSFKVCPLNPLNSCENITLINGIIVKPFCGNGQLNLNEQCDDGNIMNGDGCSDTCTIENNWKCNTNSPSVCRMIVSPTVTIIDPTPVENSYIKGSITGRALATDDNGMGGYYLRFWKGAFESGTPNLIRECSSAPGGSALGNSQNVNCSFNTTTVSDGKYVFSAQFLNSDIRWGQSLRTFYVDNTSPTATIDGVASKLLYNGSTNINVHSIDSNYLKTELYLNDETSPFKTYTDEYFGLSWLGDNNYRMVVIDKANNSTEYKFTIDRVVPVGGLLTMKTNLFPSGIAITSPDANGVYHLPDLSLDGADVFQSLSIVVTDTNLDTTKVPVYIDGITNGYMIFNSNNNVWNYGEQLGRPNFSSGIHNLVATFKDKAGNTKTLTARFTTDNTAPVGGLLTMKTNLHSNGLTVASPINGVYEITPALSITGVDIFNSLDVIVTDTDINTAKVPVYIDGNVNGNMVYKSNNLWNYEDQLGVPVFTSGPHSLVATFTDNAGNKTSLTAQFTTDAAAPIITVNKFVTNNKTPTLTGTVNDNTATVSVKINGITYTAINNGDGTWKSTIAPTIADGTYDVIASATDTAGNVGTDLTNNELTIDSIAPTATFQHYIDGTLFNGPIAYVNDINKLTFTGEYLDATPSSGLLKDSYVIFDAQKDGSFKFAQDEAKSYCGWRTEPNLVEGLSGIISHTTDPENFSNCKKSLGEGEYYMTHQVYDSAIRQDIPSITQYRDILGLHFIIDKTAPITTITSPIDSSYFKNLIKITGNTQDLNGVTSVDLSYSPYINGDCSDNYSSITTITGDSSVSFSWSYNWTPTAEGNYCLKAAGTDIAGNAEHSAIVKNIVFDITISEVSISLNPTVGDASNGWYKTQPTITLTQTDANFERIEYQWDSQVAGSWTPIDSLKPFKLLTEGEHVLYYRAIDKAQNISKVGDRNIKWDQTDLELGPQNISANPNPTSGSTSKIKWEFAKDNTGIDKYEIQWKLDDSHSYSKTVGAGTTEVEIDQLIEGRWTVKVIAFDQSGRTKDNSIDLIVDRTGPVAPTLQVTSTGTGTASLAWNAIDDAKDYIIWYGSVQGVHQYGARVGNVTSYTVKGLGAGNYYFIVKAVDAAQNQSSDSNEVNTGNIAGAAGTNPGQRAEGFSEQVLGANSEESTPTATPEIKLNDVLGVSTTKELSNWWWLLLLAIIPLYVVGKKISKKKK